MSHIHIPPEVLLKILAYVRNNDDPDFHLDLLSCSMVSRLWFDCAWPLAAKYVIPYIPLHLDNYNVVQIGYMVDAITRLRQLKVWKTTFPWVMTFINELLFEQTAQGSCAEATVRLLHALQLPSKTLEIYIPNDHFLDQVADTQEFVSKLGTTSLCIFGRNLYSGHFERLEKLEPLSILIHDLRHQLQDVTITGTYPPSFIQALSNCPNIRSVSIESTFGVSSLTAAVFSWPELRSLKILGKSEDIDPIVEQLAMNTPRHLELLHLQHCMTPQLRNLIISLAPRLVHLALPSESPDEFLALITSLDMPCLRYLDLSQLGDSLTAKNVVQRHRVVRRSAPISLLRWPKLQRINLRFCFNTSPLFLKLVMASCPALDGVQLGGDIIFYSHNHVTGWERLETILAGAGWTKNRRILSYGAPGGGHRTAVTFSRPGVDVWETEEWMEMEKAIALVNKFYHYRMDGPISSGHINADGIIVCCVGNESS